MLLISIRTPSTSSWQIGTVRPKTRGLCIRCFTCRAHQTTRLAYKQQKLECNRVRGNCCAQCITSDMGLLACCATLYSIVRHVIQRC
jgi:hypothetical protein